MSWPRACMWGVAVLSASMPACCIDPAPLPAYDACAGGCFTTLVVSQSDEPDGTPGSSCTGFPDERRPVCPGGGAGTGALALGPSTAGRLELTAGLVFEGYSLRLETETDPGARGRLCFQWVSDVGAASPTGCHVDWDCARAGTVVFTAGGAARVHAEFDGGGVIDIVTGPPLDR